MKHFVIGVLTGFALFVLISCASAPVTAVQANADKTQAVKDGLVNRAAEQAALTQGYLATAPAEVQAIPAITAAKTTIDLTRQSLAAAGYKVSTANEVRLAALVAQLSVDKDAALKALSDYKVQSTSAIIASEKQLADLSAQREALLKKSAAQAQEGEKFKSQMNSWFGLGAIWYGVKRVGMWALIILAAALILAGVIAGLGGPAGAAVLSAAGTVLKWIVKPFEWLFSHVPGAFQTILSKAGLALKKVEPEIVATAGIAYNGIHEEWHKTHALLAKVVRSIEDEIEKAGSVEAAKIKPVLAHLSETLAADEKLLVTNIKTTWGNFGKAVSHIDTWLEARIKTFINMVEAKKTSATTTPTA